jgi:pilus assembly protein Flp/PilA
MMAKVLARFTKDRRGATAIEYGLIAALIVLCILGAIGATGVTLGDLYRAALERVLAALS